MFWVEGINFKTAGFDKLKDFFLTKSRITALYDYIKKNFRDVKEMFILSTCNRTEVYYISPKSINLDKIMNSKTKFYKYSGNDAIFHFAKVITGLDSQIIGETQITGQVKSAISFALESGYAGKMLDLLLQFGISLNKHIRNSTNICKGNCSYGKILINILKQHFFYMNKIKAMVIGTGKLSENICNYLNKSGVAITIVSHKHFDIAKKLAQKYNGFPVRYNEFPRLLPENNVIITVTSSPHLILKKEHLKDVKRKIIIFDLALQRNVEDYKNDLIKIYTLKDFEQKIEVTRRLKEAEKNKAISIIKGIIYNDTRVYFHYRKLKINSDI